MATNPNPIDSTLVNLFKSLVWDSLVKKLIASILTKLMLTATGPLGWFVGTVVTKISDQLFVIFSMFADVSTIRLRNAIHQKQFDDASEKLGIVLAEHGPNSQEFQNAHAKEQDAFYNLITIKVDPLGIGG